MFAKPLLLLLVFAALQVHSVMKNSKPVKHHMLNEAIMIKQRLEHRSTFF